MKTASYGVAQTTSCRKHDTVLVIFKQKVVTFHKDW